MSPISCRNLTFSYNKQAVLKNINLTFQSGQFVGLIGANGAGKSTLLKLLLGLLKPQSGVVMVDDIDLQAQKRRDIAKKIAFVPQSTELPYAFSVEEIVAMGRNPYLGAFELLNKEDLRLIEQALHKTDIIHLRNRIVNTLSGGEKQRVIIARALAQQSPTILLDEPIASLDICHQIETLQLIESLSKNGKLAITALHDLNFAARYCDRIILLGKDAHNTTSVIADGSAQEVLNAENLRHCFSIEADIIKSENGINLVNITPLKS
ncbi:ABC transporter ATP-binding protein [Psychromonas sp. MME2]|uniref:ABC transporter ATP-binding protein n=1 Tax=unclassified Psychromonas TaxID=2614957 RepID=UPI00339C9010